MENIKTSRLDRANITHAKRLIQSSGADYEAEVTCTTLEERLGAAIQLIIRTIVQSQVKLFLAFKKTGIFLHCLLINEISKHSLQYIV
jgi:hypothetical protein